MFVSLAGPEGPGKKTSRFGLIESMAQIGNSLNIPAKALTSIKTFESSDLNSDDVHFQRYGNF